jgi:hypothetical protein
MGSRLQDDISNGLNCDMGSRLQDDISNGFNCGMDSTVTWVQDYKMVSAMYLFVVWIQLKHGFNCNMGSIETWIQL